MFDGTDNGFLGRASLGWSHEVPRALGGVQYLADGYHVDDAGNLICCTYVDVRDPVERFPITTLIKASSKRHAIPRCETIRISKPSCFLGQGEGLVAQGGEGDERPGPAGAEPVPADDLEAAQAEASYGRNGWIYCASTQPETPAQRTAWREAMPPGYDAVSPIRRPRAFARALGAMAVEQTGPRGRTVVLRNTVDGEAFSAAHRSQTVYHGPVTYAEDPYRRLERASSDLELLLLLVFLKDAAHRSQREYRFVVWAEQEPREDRMDLPVSLALFEAMQTLPRAVGGGGFAPAGVEESSTVEAIHDDGHPRAALHVEALPAFAASSNPTVAPPRYDVEALPSDLRETALVHAAAEALRAAVRQLDAESGRDAAAGAWYAEPVVRFLCSTYGGAIAGVRVNEDSFVVVTAEVSGNEPVEVTIAVGPDGTCACKVSTAHGQVASAALGARSLEQVLASRLPEVGVRGQAGADPG